MSCQKCQGKPASGRLPQNFCLCRQKPFLDMPLGAGVTAIVCSSPCFLPKNSYLSRWMLKWKFHTDTGCFWTSLAEPRLHKISMTLANTCFLNNFPVVCFLLSATRHCIIVSSSFSILFCLLRPLKTTALGVWQTLSSWNSFRNSLVICRQSIFLSWNKLISQVIVYHRQMYEHTM